MKTRTWDWTLIWLSLISTTFGNLCQGKENCGQCVRAHPDCAWCLTPVSQGYRCDYLPTMVRSCSEYFHTSNLGRVEEDRPLNSDSQDETRVVQVRPQKVWLKLKPNKPYSLKIDYKQAENYPVDLYYLMDLSNSMKDDKEKLVLLGAKLSQEMKTITKKFQLGFGAFVEKVAAPFVSIDPLGQLDYDYPYGFRNYMPLNTDTDKFKKEVNNSQISGNYDNPEGGLDALVQAVACKKEINWQENSRKLLVFSTDAGYHLAGDGKLAGIIKPNDGKCHLDRKGEYLASLTQDYPSVSQVRNILRDNKIDVIFAVTQDQVPVYTNLQRELESASVGTLQGDSSNVVELIRQQYQKITSSVRMRDDSQSPIKVTYFSSCLGGSLTQTDACQGISVGGNVSFEVRIELLTCESREWKQEFKIFPAHSNEAVEVTVEMICQCDCEKPEGEVKKSSNCSGNGSFECGICVCQPGRYGEQCQCDSYRAEGYDNTDGCFGSNHTVECSGRGNCICGECQCHARDGLEKVNGKFCECDNFSCDRHDNLPCGGPERGTCECGLCVCQPGWTGRACDCLDSIDSCRDPDSQKICGDRGDCVCGQCKCKDSKIERYEGEYCQQCLICPGSCQSYRPCVGCKIFDSGPLDSNECANCTGVYRELKDEDDVSSSHECAFDDENGCRYFFYYQLEDDSPVVKVKKQKVCPKAVNVLAIGLGVTGAVVGLGLLALLIWKLVITIHDSREYAKFLKEISEKKWNQGSNPLYKEATSTFHNPAFGNAG